MKIISFFIVLALSVISIVCSIDSFLYYYRGKKETPIMKLLWYIYLLFHWKEFKYIRNLKKRRKKQ